MFETVAPEIHVRRNRLIIYESLPVSIAVHGVAIAAVLLAAIWNVTFPDQSPRTVRAYQLVTVPDPPPPPPPPAAPKKVVVPQQTNYSPPKMQEIVAPTIIPDVIPPVVNELPKPSEMISAVPNGVEGGVEGGIAGGSLGGVMGGEIGGVKGGTIGGVKSDTPPDRVIIERDAPLPLYPVSQVYPKYPEKARLNGWQDQLVVRYIIGKDGRVRSVEVLEKPQREMFIEPAVKAIKNWRFRPMMKEGQPVEVQHELTVFFKLNQ